MTKTYYEFKKLKKKYHWKLAMIDRLRTAICGIVTLMMLGSLPADVVLDFGPMQVNRGAGTYAFTAFVQNDSPDPISILSFDLPIDLGGDGVFAAGKNQGFGFQRFSVTKPVDSEGDFSSVGVDIGGPFYDLLIGASAVGSDSGLALDPGERKKLFLLEITSDATAANDAIAAALIRTGIGAQFGRLNVGSAANNIYASDLTLGGVGFSLITVPEPTNGAVLSAIIAVAAGNRRKRLVSC